MNKEEILNTFLLANIPEIITQEEFDDVKKAIKDLQQENKQLKAIDKEYERLNKKNGRGFKITNVQEYNIDELLSYKKYKDNWNELKKWLEENESFDDYCNETTFTSVLDKMQELEQGSDSDE